MHYIQLRKNNYYNTMNFNMFGGLTSEVFECQIVGERKEDEKRG